MADLPRTDIDNKYGKLSTNIKTPDFNKKPSVLLAFYVDYNDIFMSLFVALE